MAATAGVSNETDNVLAADFRAAMAKLAAGVAIVTTLDAEGVPYGFTATSLCSLSAEPPLILVCLTKSARCYPAFAACTHFAASLLRPSHTALAFAFAGRSDDKFAHGSFARTEHGIHVLEDAVAVVECAIHARHDGGDHTILIGRVEATRIGQGRPAVYFERAVHSLQPADLANTPGSG